MVLLPKNQPKEKDITPKMFFIWGQSMSGKTYLARQFPNPIIINTDGNAKKVTTPSIEVFDFETFVKVLSEIEAGKHDFETIIIDLVDDVKTMLEVYVCKKHGVESLADAPFGKAFGDVKTTWKTLMVRLSQLPYNIVFISHVVETPDEANSQRMIEVPSLEQKFYNMTMGRCDVSIKSRKLGSTYLQMAVNKRDTYHIEDFKKSPLIDILKNVKGMFETGENKIATAPVAKPPVAKKTVKKATITVAPEPENMSPQQIMEHEPEAKIEIEEVLTAENAPVPTSAPEAPKPLKKLRPLKKA